MIKSVQLHCMFTFICWFLGLDICCCLLLFLWSVRLLVFIFWLVWVLLILFVCFVGGCGLFCLFLLWTTQNEMKFPTDFFHLYLLPDLHTKPVILPYLTFTFRLRVAYYFFILSTKMHIWFVMLNFRMVPCNTGFLFQTARHTTWSTMFAFIRLP